MNFEKMTSEDLVSHINTNLEALEYIEQSKRTVLNGFINEGASYEEMLEVVEDLYNAYLPRVNYLRLENEFVAKILWERAENDRLQ